MPRIRLWTEPDDNPVSIPFRTPGGTVESLTNDRLYCWVYAGRDPKPHRAVIDTGAPSTLFPVGVWRRFAAQIQWLDFPSGPTVRTGVLAGKNYSFKLGRVSVQIGGRDKEPRLPPVEIVAQFEQLDPTINPADRLKYPIVGLQFGPLENRYLVVSPNQTHPERCEAWITDERPVDPLAATF